MGRPLKSVFKKEHRDDISNRSANPVFSEVAEVFLSRRRFLQMGAVAGAAVSFPYLITPENAIAAVSKPSALAKAVSWALPASTSVRKTRSGCRKVISPARSIAGAIRRGSRTTCRPLSRTPAIPQTNRLCRRACTTTAWRGLACRRGAKPGAWPAGAEP